MPKCPKCKSKDVVKYDEAPIRGVLVKYYKCKCGERFSKTG